MKSRSADEFSLEDAPRPRRREDRRRDEPRPVSVEPSGAGASAREMPAAAEQPAADEPADADFVEHAVDAPSPASRAGGRNSMVAAVRGFPLVARIGVVLVAILLPLAGGYAVIEMLTAEQRGVELPETMTELRPVPPQVEGEPAAASPPADATPVQVAPADGQAGLVPAAPEEDAATPVVLGEADPGGETCPVDLGPPAASN